MYNELIDTVAVNKEFAIDSMNQVMAMLDSPATIKSVLIESINSAMHNDFFQGGALLALLAAVGYQLKAVPLGIWRRFVKAIQYTVYLDSTNQIFGLFTTWLTTKHPKKFKNVIVEIGHGNRMLGPNKRFTIDIKQGTDWNWFFYKGSFIVAHKSRERLENASSVDDRYIDAYELKCYLSRKGINALLEEVRMLRVNDENIDNEIFFNNTGGRWSTLEMDNIKSFDNIFLDNKQELIDDLTSFASNKEHYRRLGINSKRGYLFYGSPGNGKTTLALAMSKHLNMDLYIINLKSLHGDKEFTSLISDVNKNSIILFEDIDSYAKDRFGEKDKSNVSFSTLLNTLNGAFEPNDCIIIMTTNHKDVLDDALIRPGRIDKTMHIDNPKWGSVFNFMKAFYLDFEGLHINQKKVIGCTFDFEQQFPLSMSAIQNLCLANSTPDGWKLVLTLLEKSLSQPLILTNPEDGNETTDDKSQTSD